MTDTALALAACEREPIHTPGSIQPHGALLVADRQSLTVTHAAGDVAGLVGVSAWHGRTIRDLLGAAAEAAARRVVAGEAPVQLLAGPSSRDITLYGSGPHVVAEIEPDIASTVGPLLPALEAAATALERAPTLQHLFDVAAREFQRLTGYARVMIYRFLDDDAGVVVAEAAASGQHSFLNHHFPAADIPRQARALYVRNLVRVIPDVAYRPAPLEPAWQEREPLDLSDSILRSVSPIHIRYLKNMEVAASASVSIVKDGALWGLVACHNDAPLLIPAEVRGACRALASSLARQIKSREETDSYRERVRLRSTADDIVALLSREGSLDVAISNHLDDIMRMLGADGVAVLRGRDLVTGGRCPGDDDVRALARFAVDKASETVFATDMLAKHLPLSSRDAGLAAGLLAITISTSEPWVVLWFRAEQVTVVDWAGNPHKELTVGANGELNPRASFEKWSETVRGRSRRWTIPEIEAAGHLRGAVAGVWNNRRIRDLNRELMRTVEQKELLIRQKEFLIGEVNHRVQNSLQLVSNFLALQARGAEAEPRFAAAVDEARRRISAVSLVHRRLYRSDQIEAIDAARYLDELLSDLIASFGEEWRSQLTLDLQPVLLPTDRAVAVGLILTELVINANKYAYGGAAGPLHVALAEDRNRFRITVADHGVGRVAVRRGFGSRMMEALVGQIGGTLEYTDNAPGTRATLSATITQA